jgi:hypothetical protein
MKDSRLAATDHLVSNAHAIPTRLRQTHRADWIGLQSAGYYAPDDRPS